ncbi:MAG: metallophosphoesterase [Porticoccaceae bacterium]|nr:metallophosphoesterase [Porticoccaceae bacterium]
MAKHLVIPDTQVKPNQPTEHLRWAGLYAAEKKPDVIVHIGDHFDMPSLSAWDVGKRSFEGRRYTDDVAAGIEAMQVFLDPIREEQQRLITNKKKQWNPRLVFTLGNHEQRIERAIEGDAKLDGLIGYDDLQLNEMGFEVYDFLDVAVIDGLAYSHYFTSGIMGRPCASARNMLSKKMMSCIMGHVQDRDIAYARRADGRNILGLFAGIYYQHDESYLTAQTNGSWRGIWMLNEVEDGGCDELPVSINYLRKKYEGK